MDIDKKMKLFYRPKPNHFINSNLIHLRHELGISQYLISKNLKIHNNTYATFEEYRSVPKIELIIKMADYFRVKLEDFITKDLSKEKLEYIDKSFVQL